MIQSNVSDDRRIKKGTHQLCALAFVRVEDVERHFITVRAVLPDELSDIADWFEINYIRRRVARRRGSAGLLLRSYPPRYPLRLWNVYESVLNNTARTNKLSEGWHCRFQHVVGKHHRSLYAFFEELKKEQEESEGMLRQLGLGQRIRRVTEKKRREREQKISNLVHDYNEYDHRNNICVHLIPNKILV